MSVPTEYTITAACGHERTFSLAEVRAGLRAGIVKTRSNALCPSCQQVQDRASAYARDMDSAAVVEGEFDLPELSGPVRQMRYARIYRAQLLTRAYDVFGGNDDGLSPQEELECHARFSLQVLDAARLITSAAWWCENRNADSEDVAELVNSMRTSQPA